MAAYKLYGNEMSFYTGKVRAYLDWKGLSYGGNTPQPRDLQNCSLT